MDRDWHVSCILEHNNGCYYQAKLCREDGYFGDWLSVDIHDTSILVNGSFEVNDERELLPAILEWNTALSLKCACAIALGGLSKLQKDADWTCLNKIFMKYFEDKPAYEWEPDTVKLLLNMLNSGILPDLRHINP